MGQVPGLDPGLPETYGAVQQQSGDETESEDHAAMPTGPVFAHGDSGRTMKNACGLGLNAAALVGPPDVFAD